MSYKNRIFVANDDNIATFVDKTNNTIQRVGNLTNMSASVQVDSDLVSAIGSIADSIGTGALSTTAQTLKGAVNEIDTRLDSDTLNLKTLNSDRDSAASNLSTLNTNRDSAAASMNQLMLDRDSDETNIKQLNSDRDSAASNLSTLNTNRDSAAASMNQLMLDRDSTASNLSTLNSHRDSNSALIGTASFNTTATTITGAINEHEADIGNMTFTGLSATDISGAIRELRTELGDHSSLTTTATTDVVSAINEINAELYASPDGSGSNFNTTAATIEGAINELDSDIGEIVDLSDSVRAENSTAVNAINYVWQFAKQVDNNQTTSGNLLGNLSTLDNEIERTSFALSINSLRDSVNSLTDSLNNVIYGGGGTGINGRIQDLIDSTNKIGVVANKGLNYNQTTRKFSIADSIDAGTDTIVFKNGANTFATFTRYQDSDLRISAGDAGSSAIVIGDSSVTVDGNFRVTGTTLFVQSETVQIADNIIQLNSNATGNAVGNAGIEVNRGSYQNVGLLWDEPTNVWKAAIDSDNNLSQIVTNANLSVGEGGAGTKALAWSNSQISHRTASPTDLSEDNADLTFIQDISFTFDSHGHATASSVGTGTVSAGTYLSNVGGTINHDDTTRNDTSTGDSTLVPSGTIELISSVSTNTQGHVTAVNVPTFTMPAIGETLEIRNAAGTLLKTIKSYT